MGAVADNDVVILTAHRTAMGAFMGQLASESAPTMAGHVIRHSMAPFAASAMEIDEVLMGCVLPAGVGQAPARQACLKAGLAEHIGATTINKVCGSGMKSVMLGVQAIRAGARMVIAGGMESMSQAPYLLNQSRAGYRIGHHSVLDHMFVDGLEDAHTGRSMGSFAEATAQAQGLTREAQDAFAVQSLTRAKQAIDDGAFQDEIVPQTLATKQGEQLIHIDEPALKARLDKIPHLKPAFAADGTITAANASSIADGAAVLILAQAGVARKLKLPWLAVVRGQTTFAHAPAEFTTAPVGAMTALLDQVGWSAAAVDLYEINEAFAMVTMLAMQALKLAPEQVNIRGGACALGHPIGCSGARILVTLIHALRQTKAQKGIASLCIGGGEATAVALEICDHS
ncbi:MAG: acetyl-CoA C-acyltransferase [Shewanellaceae bacterium]|nr:acetyl-CoA C-acyltransferase [Shewanellaceae bacterium]